MNNYERGSEWKKWDLHVHSPYSFLNGKFDGASDDDFINQVIDKKLSVIGLTNYFNFKDEEFSLKKKLERKGIKVLLNLEIRLDYQNKEDDCLDFHIIFSENVSEKNINKFLINLTVNVNGEDKKCTELSSTDDFKLGVINYDHLMEKLNEESCGVKGRFLTGFLSRGKGNARSSSNYEKISSKSDLLIHSTDSAENIEKDVSYWRDKKKPLLQGSDAHNLQNIGSKFSWIKADTTFEGLKQILCEPDSRVRIQAIRPEEKSSYYVIESINIDHADCRQKILLNSNLNTIIGGRSTGKSTLLKLIAYKINPNIVDITENEFVKGIAKSSNIFWQDNEQDKQRDIEFFSQNHMYSIARDKSAKDNLIEKIVKEKGSDNLIKIYNIFCENNKSTLQTNIDDLFKLQKDIDKLNADLKEKGDESALDKEIESLQEKIKTAHQDINFTLDELEQFKQLTKEISELVQSQEALIKDKDEITMLKEQGLFDSSFEYRFNQLSEANATFIKAIFNDVKRQATGKWRNELDNKLNNIDEQLKAINNDIQGKKSSGIFNRGSEYLENNKQHKELSNRLNAENKKLAEIVVIQKQVEKLNKQKGDLFNTTIVKHIAYAKKIDDLVKQFSLEHDDIKIKIEKTYLDDKCKNLLDGFINLKSHKRQNFVNQWSENYQIQIKENIKKFLDEALENKIELKAHKDIKDLTKELLTKNWFSISYELSYQKDKFEVMSDGKKAFVILKLLLEFSEKECPILIDQPEDSLDNRAIYNELVTYLKQKKKERQIILVTHNANIVVNADAEEVIVANQHGDDSRNDDDIKFQYISGSLENTSKKSFSTDIVLKSQGIREHVCEILEGGTVAFKKRENKYAITTS